MSTRTNIHEEKAATLQSVMNVIGMLDQGSPQRSTVLRTLDLRPLFPDFDSLHEDESWEPFIVVLADNEA